MGGKGGVPIAAKVVVSNKFIFGKQDFKYFIGYKDDKEIRPLCIFPWEMSKCERYSDKAKYMYFIYKGEKCFEKHMTLWENVSNIIK